MEDNYCANNDMLVNIAFTDCQIHLQLDCFCVCIFSINANIGMADNTTRTIEIDK